MHHWSKKKGSLAACGKLLLALATLIGLVVAVVAVVAPVVVVASVVSVVVVSFVVVVIVVVVVGARSLVSVLLGEKSPSSSGILEPLGVPKIIELFWFGPGNVNFSFFCCFF